MADRGFITEAIQRTIDGQGTADALALMTTVEGYLSNNTADRVTKTDYATEIYYQAAQLVCEPAHAIAALVALAQFGHNLARFTATVEGTTIDTVLQRWGIKIAEGQQ